MKKSLYKTNGSNGVADLLKELWNAAVALRGNIEPADYKRYVLPLIFLRFLSLRYEKRRAEIDAEIADPQSDLLHHRRAAYALAAAKTRTSTRASRSSSSPRKRAGTTSSRSPAPTT